MPATGFGALASLAGRFQSLGAHALAALPPRVQLRLSGRPPVHVDGETLDPGIQLLLRVMQLRRSPSFVRLGARDVAAERRRVRAEAALAQGRPTPVASVRDIKVDGASGPLPARHYAPPTLASDSERRPLLLYVHGGGWVVGDLDTHDEICRLICRHSDVHVVSIEYALAPEHPFPAAVEDVEAAARWALARAGDLGGDSARVALAGDSAGGNLVAVTCQALARQGGPQPALQVLLYPGTDFGTEWRSYRLFDQGFYLDEASRNWCRQRYLPAGTDVNDPRASPLRGDLRGLPPAIIITASFDPLRDEGEAYAHRLQEAGGRVVLRRAPGMIHGFLSMTGVSRTAREEAMRLTGMIRQHLQAMPVAASSADALPREHSGPAGAPASTGS